jgi:hypothetical protein
LAKVVCAALAQTGPLAEPAHAPLRFRAPLEDKNFYLLSQIGAAAESLQRLYESQPPRAPDGRRAVARERPVHPL